jgi:chromosome segregation ATPase
MALTGKKAPRDGWRHQAERLADTHTAVATAVMAATEQARRRPLLKPVSCDFPTRGAEYKRGLETSKTEPANEIEPTRVELAELEQQVARETAATWILNARRDTLAARAARAAAAEKRIAELEGDLGSARERLVLLENENHSLQSSLELTVSENSRLSCRLTESDAAGDRARSQLEQVKRPLTSVEAERNRLAAAGHEARSQLEQTTAALVTTEAERITLSFAVNEARSKLEQMKEALATAKAERITLSFAVDEVNKKRQTETNTLNTRLGAMSERAVTAEKLLAKAQRRLLVRTAENCSVERKFADATVARDAAHKKLELLQNSLQVKERQVQELERSRSELIEVTTTLLKAFKTRNIALARAEQRIKLLSELLTQLEADNAC